MRTITPYMVVVGGLCSLFANSNVSAQERGDRPNVLILLADDLGWSDVGFNNSGTFYDTPHLDRLAHQSARFTAAYAACPVCSPTRASLMTGRHPARIDTTDWFGAPQPEAVLAAAKEGGNRLKRFRALPLLPAPYVAALPLEEVTIAELLKGAGYATFFAGKWHLGGMGFGPEAQGFDVNVAGNHRGGPYGPGKYFHPFGMPNLTSTEGDHLPARLAEETCAFIAENRESPWFCTLSFYSVHTPLVGRPDLVKKYKTKRAALEAAGDMPDVWGREGDRRVRQSQNHAVYAAMVTAMDEAVGDVLAKLDELEIADNTLVIFFSDNGGVSTSEGHPTSNLPLRAGKGWLYEGGVREPCLVRWPGRVDAGYVIETPVQSVDFLPTVAEAAGAELSADIALDGVSLLPLLQAKTELAPRALYWHYPHYGNQGGFPGGAMLEGGWKWIERYGSNVPGTPRNRTAGELYNVGSDIGEVAECSAEHPERAKAMAAAFTRWRKSVDAKMPRANPLLNSGSGPPVK